MNRQELEETNDNLQVEIAGLQQELLNAPPAKLAEENSRLQDEMEGLRVQLEDSENLRASLQGMVTAFQQQRANELAELEEGRRQLRDLRQIELNRLGEEASKLAGEWDLLAEERETMQEEAAQAKSAERAALTSAEGWKRQSTEMFDRMTKAMAEKQTAGEQLQLRELEITRLGTQVQRLRETDTRAGWIQFLELLSNNAGTLWVIFLAFTMLICLFFVARWIWNWMWL
jgi:chromosome segregation ATPase